MQRSIEDHIRECKEVAERKGYIVPDELIFRDEAASGRTRNRPGLNALLAAAKSGRLGAVVIYATSRIHRKSYRTLQMLNEEFVERGIRVLTCTQGLDSHDETRANETRSLPWWSEYRDSGCVNCQAVLSVSHGSLQG